MSTISSEEPAAKRPKSDEESAESDSHDSHEPSGAFSSPWHFSDVVLIVEGQRLHVHKSTLSMSSPVFEAMFTSDFKEKTALEIPLPGKRADEVEVLLNLICFKNKQRVTRSHADLDTCTRYFGDLSSLLGRLCPVEYRQYGTFGQILFTIECCLDI
ncbi:hypothetical protein QZH41_013210 [Actinostola sp. cb2023]|nr:hypothetical protein QZH41_013210 [Actinostola sp. cb2023]